MAATGKFNTCLSFILTKGPLVSQPVELHTLKIKYKNKISAIENYIKLQIITQSFNLSINKC